MKRSGRLWDRFGLLFLTILFTLLVIWAGFEIVLRISHSEWKQKVLEKYPDRELCTMKSDDPRLIYELKPNMCGTNSQGHIDVEHNLSKGSRKRVVVIGDSVAAGQGVEESFGRMLESDELEVIVMAVTGYSTVQELVLLEKSIGYNPDVIVWSYVLNDPVHPVFHNADSELARYFYEPDSYFVDYIRRAIFFIGERLKSRECTGEYHQLLHCVYWDEVVENIRKIGSISGEVPVIFLIHPAFESGEYSLADLHNQLGAAAKSEGLAVMDVWDVYGNYDIDDIKLHSDEWYDPWHPNELGHRIIADYLYPALLPEEANHQK